MKKEILLTQEGYEKLKTELADLKKRRKQVAERIKVAREFGDLSENSEYDDARNEQSFVEGKIEEIEEMMANAKIVAKKAGAAKAEMGSTVTLELDGEKFSYELVGANESDPINGKISVESPLGHSVIGKGKGEQVEINGPSGKVLWKIVGVK